jgi:hypothetical protein
MNATQANKLNSYLAVQGTLESHTDVWKSLPAFAVGAEELDEHISSIQSLAQTQTSQNGAAAEKAQTFQALVGAAYEVAAATRACAVASSNQELARRVDFSRSNVGRGRDTAVVARCQDILAAATENVGSLGDYGVNQAKLNGLKKKIENFQTVQAKPRQGRATSSAATKQLGQLFGEADELLNERLDALVVQFKQSQPAFFNAYNAARVTVRITGGRASKQATAVPVPGTTSAIKAA